MTRVRLSSSFTSLLVVLLLAVAGSRATAQEIIESEEHRFRIDTVASGLEFPWGITFLPNGDVLVTERPGRVRLVRDGALRAAPIDGGPQVRARGQGGLLDIAAHPRFAENRFVYLTYSKPGTRGGTTALARARFENDRLVGLEDLFVADAWSNAGQHFGSRIVFDSAGYVFFGVGDRGDRDRAQNRLDHAGTVIRLHDDGRVPTDNPFVGRRDARPEIWSYGHRNPQGMTLHPVTGELWENEHGARGGDEINLVRPGRNYGWPLITHGINYNGERISPDTARAGLEQPQLHWTPSIAVSGMAIYLGDRFAGWRGNVLNGSLAGRQLRRVVFDGHRPTHQETLLQGRMPIRQVKVGPDGDIYLLSHLREGAVLRLSPVAP